MLPFGPGSGAQTEAELQTRLHHVRSVFPLGNSKKTLPKPRLWETAGSLAAVELQKGGNAFKGHTFQYLLETLPISDLVIESWRMFLQGFLKSVRLRVAERRGTSPTH